MKKILMLGTGGTIASRQTKDGLAPGLTPEDILSYIPAVKNVCEVQTKQVCNLDSTNVTPEHWKMMVKAVEDNYAYYDGFVICHGTDTLAYTAAALSYMIQNSAKPIVVTGAQKPINMDVTDAKTNLLDSFIYAADDDSQGVNLVFDGKGNCRNTCEERACKELQCIFEYQFSVSCSYSGWYPGPVYSGDSVPPCS